MILNNKYIRFISNKLIIAFFTIIFRIISLSSKYKISKNCKIDGLVFINKSKTGILKIGKNFTLNSRKASNLVGITNRASFQIINEGRIEIGDNCGFTSTVLSSRKLIKIGNNVLIGGNVRIYDHDYHSLNYLNRRNSKLDAQNVKTSEVIIEDDVFIGTNSIILKGVKIGARSIIGAGSVVSLKNIPPDSIVAGNPSKILKSIKL
jgi:acetyltransferase-like isoleucine patch superfamily enzyme